MSREPGASESATEKSDRPIDATNDDILESLTNKLTVMPSSLPIQSLEPIQHGIIHHLSYIEKECIEEAANSLNTLRASSDYLAEGHPDVLALSSKIFKQAVDEMKKNNIPVEDFGGEAWTHLRSIYRQKFGAFLKNRINSALGINQVPSQVNLPFAQNKMSRSGQDALIGFHNVISGDSTYERQYHQIRIVGQGGYGKVYHAFNLIDHQHYAIKKMVFDEERMRKLYSEGCLETLLKEVRTLAKLTHPNIVRYYGSWIEPLRKEASNPRDTAQALLENQEYNTASDYATDESGHSTNESLSFSRSDGRSHEGNFIIFESSKNSIGEIARRHASVQDAEDDDEKEDEEDEGESEEEKAKMKDGVVNGMVKPMFSQKTFSAKTTSPLLTKDLTNNGVTLFIKMSLHPLTLSEYLAPDYNSTLTNGAQPCFHMVPAAKICLGILDGIEYLHGQNIVHRDLKPANVLLSIDYNKSGHLSGFFNISGCPQCNEKEANRHIYIKPCVSDFGLVAKLDDPDEISKGLGKLIKAEKAVGTRLYRPANMPTEEPSICPKLDIYSLGIIAFELVMKFDTESERRKVLSDLAYGKYPDGFDKHEMAEGIKAMLNDNRGQRWGAKEVRLWLEELIVKKTAETK